MGLIPSVAIAEEALAFTEGALKYGKYNWRVAGVRSSIYIAAMMRHLAKYQNGENRDVETGVHHLASVRACAAIILDSTLQGNLVDDRPPSSLQTGKHIDSLAGQVETLQEIFKDHKPHQHSCLDQLPDSNAIVPIGK